MLSNPLRGLHTDDPRKSFYENSLRYYERKPFALRSLTLMVIDKTEFTFTKAVATSFTVGNTYHYYYIGHRLKIILK